MNPTLRKIAPSALAALALPLALASSAPRLEGQYLLTASLGLRGQSLAVSVGGKTFSLNEGNADLRTDITGLLKAGPNSVRVRYAGLGTVNEVSVAYASEPNRFRTIFDLDLNVVSAPKTADQTYTLVADGPRGAGRTSSGSATNQTVMKTNSLSTPLTVILNGTAIGDYPGITTRDISSYVRPGENTLKVSWRRTRGGGLPNATLEIAHAAARDQFRTVFNWKPDLFGAGAGEKTLRFTVPRN